MSNFAFWRRNVTGACYLLILRSLLYQTHDAFVGLCGIITSSWSPQHQIQPSLGWRRLNWSEMGTMMSCWAPIDLLCYGSPAWIKKVGEFGLISLPKVWHVLDPELRYRLLCADSLQTQGLDGCCTRMWDRLGRACKKIECSRQMDDGSISVFFLKFNMFYLSTCTQPLCKHVMNRITFHCRLLDSIHTLGGGWCQGRKGCQGGEGCKASK